MKYSNAFAGVKKLYTSEILAIIMMAFVLITIFAGFFTIEVIDAGIEEAVNPGLAVTGVFSIITGILSIVCLILNFLGLNQAGKDEPTFKFALYASLLGMLVQIINSFLSDGALKEILSVIKDIVMLLVPLLSISGIMSLAKECGDSDMENRGKSLINLITASIIFATVADIIYHFFVNGAIVLGIIAIGIDLIASLIYLGYLKRAKKMLAKETAF